MEIMQQVKGRSAQVDDLCGWQRCARTASIDVTDSGQRCDFLEGRQDLCVADVSRVKNVVDSGKRVQRLRPQ